MELDKIAVDKLRKDEFGFLTGLAGSGKSTLINEVDRQNLGLLEKCATTGIAAINLNSRTIHSLLKFYDVQSLKLSFMRGTLHKNLSIIRKRASKILLDEASMFSADLLDLVVEAIDSVNDEHGGRNLGLWLTGDLVQLPPVNAPYVFESKYWDRFDSNTVKLDKIWRQQNKEFLDGINLIRAGKGSEAVQTLKSSGVTFASEIDDNFQGTTLVSTNAGVDIYNAKRLNMIRSPEIIVYPTYEGEESPEWKRLVADKTTLKVGALVMILSNDTPNFTYANGDLGIIDSYNKKTQRFDVKLKRNGHVVSIGRIERLNLSDYRPRNAINGYIPTRDPKTGMWIIGKVQFHPLRIGYASTIHKSQGLSLDAVQIDTSGGFFGSDSMAYVAISRAKTPEGLRLVGDPSTIARKIRINPLVHRYV
jgi:ATP-dependent DNA helicase PIF1